MNAFINNDQRKNSVVQQQRDGKLVGLVSRGEVPNGVKNVTWAAVAAPSVHEHHAR
jgi:hypothetical protein